MQMLPLIRLAMAAAKASAKTRGGASERVAPHGVNLLGSPWSPPAWMKRPVKGHQNMTGSAEPHCLIDTDAVKKAWALYIVKFVIAYEAKGALHFPPAVRLSSPYLAPSSPYLAPI